MPDRSTVVNDTAKREQRLSFKANVTTVAAQDGVFQITPSRCGVECCIWEDLES
jgi:hypothetical protein